MSKVHDIEKRMADLADQMKRMQVELEAAKMKRRQVEFEEAQAAAEAVACLLYTSPSPRDS